MKGALFWATDNFTHKRLGGFNFRWDERGCFWIQIVEEVKSGRIGSSSVGREGICLSIISCNRSELRKVWKGQLCHVVYKRNINRIDSTNLLYARTQKKKATRLSITEYVLFVNVPSAAVAVSEGLGVCPGGVFPVGSA